MYDIDKLRKTLVNGLSNALKVPVIRSDQNAEPPKYPYIVYTVTILAKHDRGTWGEYEDGKARKPFTQTISVKALSDDWGESNSLAMTARNWLDYAGRLFLKDNEVIVQSVGEVSERSNMLTVEYEYAHGFDAVFWCMDDQEMDIDTIDSVTITGSDTKIQIGGE